MKFNIIAVSIIIVIISTIIGFCIQLYKNKSLLNSYAPVMTYIYSCVNDTIQIMTMDISKYDTEEEFTNALAAAVAKSMTEHLSSETSANINNTELLNLILTIFKWKKKELKISEVYNNAKKVTQLQPVNSVEEAMFNSIKETDKTAMVTNTIKSKEESNTPIENPTTVDGKNPDIETPKTVNISSVINDYYEE